MDQVNHVLVVPDKKHGALTELLLSAVIDVILIRWAIRSLRIIDMNLEMN